MSRQLVRAFVAVFFAVAFTTNTFGEWKAGAAKLAITPTQPTWMSGYASRNHPSEGTLHDLWAKSLVIEDPTGKKMILVTLDLVGIGREISVEICDRLQKEHGVDRSQIAISTSHTHTGPVVGRNLGTMYFLNAEQQKRVTDYADFLVNQISQSVSTAMQNVEPATLSFGMGQATFAVNRRTNREADVPNLREAGELKGPVDHAAPVLSVKNSNGDLTAVVVGYACHATVLSFYQFSGDWPGFAQIEIEKRHPGTIALFVTGCGADQNPLPRRTVELAEDYGKQLATAVDEVLNGDMVTVKGSLAAEYHEIALDFAALPTREALTTDTESTNKFIVSRATELLKKLDADGQLDQTYPAYPIQTWAIGDTARLVFLGGEVVVDYSIRVREEFPDSMLWVAGYCNDVMAYIPSRRVLMEGGYEGASSMIYYGLPTVWAESVEERIVTKIGEQLQQLSKQPGNTD